MSNDLVDINLGGDADINVLAQSTQGEAKIPNLNPYLKLDQRSGDWSFGVEDNIVGEDTMFFPKLDSFKKGWVEQIQREYGNKILGPASNPPDINDLKCKLNTNDPQHKISPCYLIELVCIGGEYLGQTITYEASNTGGVNAIGRMFDEIKTFRDNNPGSQAVCIFYINSSRDRKNPDRCYPRFNTVYWDDKSLQATKNRREDLVQLEDQQEEKVIPAEKVQVEPFSDSSESPAPKRRRRVVN